MPLDSPEILAPAGNWDCVRAAVANGAHAVYFGLDRFNARMRADNFTRDDLATLIPYLHRHGVRACVTMNVLIFPDEWQEAQQYLDELDRARVDAVIVQDIGLAQLISRRRREGRWQLELHISTQMTVTGPESVRLIDEVLDPQQIVLARELSLEEIAACARATTKPIEVFCHGALCVAYSGQCLTSESLGLRSANRGECAQACRLPYRLEVDGRLRDLGERRYLFSPQDLCALERIPQMLAAGVRSFKIEGRLKSPEYVAATTRAYRRALDDALALRAPSQAQQREDLYAMQMAFSRGFSTGWLDGTDHPRLTHGRFGKKRGALVGRLARCGEGWIELAGESVVPLAPGDGFVIDAGQDRNEEQGGRIWRVSGRRLFFHGKGSHIRWSSVHPGQLLWKTDDPALDKRLRATWAHFDKPEAPSAAEQSLEMEVEGRVGVPLALRCRGICILSRRPLEAARQHPLTQETLAAQLGRLGGTPYRLGRLHCRLEGELMMPLSELNFMRRQLVAALETAPAEEAAADASKPADSVASATHPSSVAEATPVPAAGSGASSPTVQAAAETSPAGEGETPASLVEAPALPELSVLCRSEEQALAAVNNGLSRIYLDLRHMRDFADCAERLREADPACRIWPATLRIMKPHEAGYFKYLLAAEPDGILVRNIGAVQWLREHTKLPLIGDFSLNTANAASIEFWRRLGLRLCTVSYDLNAQQLDDLLRCGCGPQLELTLHQHMPLFHMEHCVFCTFLSQGHNFKDCGQPCDHHSVRVQDRTGAMHRLIGDEACRNTLFNGRAQTAARLTDSLMQRGLRRFRIELLDENAARAAELIELYRRRLSGQVSAEELIRRLGALDRLGVTEGTLR